MSSSLPPDLFDKTTLLSLASTALIVLAAYAASVRALGASAPGSLRFLFVWHLADALCHLLLEGSFLYLCFFAYRGTGEPGTAGALFPTPYNFLGSRAERVYGPQSAPPGNPFGELWMVYARADRRWAGVDLGVVSLEILTVLLGTPLALYICALLAKRDPRASIWMIVLATAELYGGWMTFCPEWLVGSPNLDGSNFMYLWVYLVFFNGLWVVIPLWVIRYAIADITNALAMRDARKGK
ncbi:putative emopamil-binding protein [Escovopsis weberi]|uniref:Putative emopamil-binding protein n=1 Tax=Escovopsis weberi TaxID=150374 RepID=A0A0M8N3J4_ESCWE|nr:putative emopamil-binding protein [Escovopsis weberi]